VIGLKFWTQSMVLLAALAGPVLAQEAESAASDGARLGLVATEPPPFKDAQIGDAASQDTKDALFGASASPAEKSGVKWSGSFEGLGAYTFSDPSHWSRGVGRFTMAAQGELSESVKWKLSGRVDGDVVYATSDFYLPPVKANQRFSAFWGENYIDFAASDSWDFRVGAQQIIWGEVVGLFFADVVSARDMREFLLPRFDVIRIPQWAARAEYFAGDSHVELIWIPVPTFDRIGKPGADFYPVRLPSPTAPAVAALFQDPQRPDRNLGNSNYGVRANTLVSGWDMAAFYYRSFSSSPTFYRVYTAAPERPFVFQPSYDRIWQAGGTVTKDFGEMVLRAEAVYANGQGYGVTSLAVPTGVVERSTLDYIVSVEFPLPGDTRLNIQGFQRAYFNGGSSDIAVKSDGFGATIFLSTKLSAAFEPQILWIQNFKNAGGLVRPRLNWYPAKNTTFGFGVDIFTGPNDGYFGRYNNRDRVYAEMRLDF